MLQSPLLSSAGVFEFFVKADGKEIPGKNPLVSAKIEFKINEIPKATIVVDDGYMPMGEFALFDSGLMKTGKEVVIEASYAQKRKEVFKGVVVRGGVRIERNGTSSFRAECRDKAVAMTSVRKNANFSGKSDADAVKKLISDNGLEACVSISGGPRNELVQYYCSDWDFMLMRAEANGCWVNVKSGKVTVEKIGTEKQKEVSLTWGTDIISFKSDSDALEQKSDFTARSWNVSKQAIETNTKKSKTCGIDGGPALLMTPTPLQKSDLANWVSSAKSRAELAKIRGSVICVGTADVFPGDYVTLNGVGKDFEGERLVTGVTHRMKAGSWETEIIFGMDPTSYAERFHTAAPLAAGITSGVMGLVPAVVLKLDGDPDNQGRIQVSVPIMSNTPEGIWARLASPYASSGFGSFFVPEVGDEVVLGFFGGDPSCPVILGSLFSSVRVSPQKIDAKNNIKTLVTRSKVAVEIDDEKKKLTVKTPDSRTIILDDDEKKMMLFDSKGNKIEMSDSGIAIMCNKDISITAKGAVKIEANKDLSLASKTGAVKGEGLNVEFLGKNGFKAKGNATAEISAGGKTTVKGAVVMIN